MAFKIKNPFTSIYCNSNNIPRGIQKMQSKIPIDYTEVVIEKTKEIN